MNILKIATLGLFLIFSDAWAHEGHEVQCSDGNRTAGFTYYEDEWMGSSITRPTSADWDEACKRGLEEATKWAIWKCHASGRQICALAHKYFEHKESSDGDRFYCRVYVIVHGKHED